LFTPDYVLVREIVDRSQFFSIGKVHHNALLYSFSHFVQEYPTNVLLSHSNELIKLWHERFGHLKYLYLQQISKKNMVTDLPPISFVDGV